MEMMNIKTGKVWRDTKNDFVVVFILVLLTGVSISWADTDDINSGVPDSAEKIKPLKTGEKLPDLTLTTEEGKPFELGSAVSKQPAVLVFYRGRW
jgi:hypothetical protein